MAFIVSLLFAFVPTLLMAWFVYWLEPLRKRAACFNRGNLLLGNGDCRRKRLCDQHNIRLGNLHGYGVGCHFEPGHGLPSGTFC